MYKETWMRKSLFIFTSYKKINTLKSMHVIFLDRKRSLNRLLTLHTNSIESETVRRKVLYVVIFKVERVGYLISIREKIHPCINDEFIYK